MKVHFKYRFLYRSTMFLLAFIIFISNLSSYLVYANPTDKDSDFVWPSGPPVSAASAIVMEASTGLILYEKDIYTAYYPASITKVLTTLLALENCNLNETMTMSHEAEWDVDFDSSRIGLVEGEQISLEDALYAVMLESANEVSHGVSEHVAGGNIDDFSAMMNERVKELGGVNSNFTNPHGLHDPNHYTCAYDMALISQAAIAIPEFRKITGTRTYLIPATNKNTHRYLANHHRFIRQTMQYNGAIGGKTGGTAEAKTTLVTFAERDGLLLIAVVLFVGVAVDAYEDTAAILDFSFENYSSYNIIQTENKDEITFPPIFDYGPRFGYPSESLLQIGKNSSVILPKTADFKDAEKSITLEPVDELIHGDNIIGQISYTYEGKYVGYADIVYDNPDHPLTKTEFNERWPNYLVYPEITAPDQTESVSEKLTQDPKDTSGFFHMTAFIISIAIFVIITTIGLLIVFKKKKEPAI